VKVNNFGQGTCTEKDSEDPNTGLKDGVKDLVCQFPTSGLPAGKHFGIVAGRFIVSGEIRNFLARQEVTILP
jgi:hypothetical protein